MTTIPIGGRPAGGWVYSWERRTTVDCDCPLLCNLAVWCFIRHLLRPRPPPLPRGFGR
jgi:hypothetical protein